MCEAYLNIFSCVFFCFFLFTFSFLLPESQNRKINLSISFPKVQESRCGSMHQWCCQNNQKFAAIKKYQYDDIPFQPVWQSKFFFRCMCLYSTITYFLPGISLTSYSCISYNFYASYYNSYTFLSY